MQNQQDLLTVLFEKKPDLLSDYQKVVKQYPFKTTQYYSSLVNMDLRDDDPILKQIFPSSKEIMKNSAYTEDDPLYEENQMPVNNLIHRYRDRAVLLTTNACAVFCRFCMRKRKWNNHKKISKISREELNTIQKYLYSHPEIREVLISGGDPLTLTNNELDHIMQTLSSVPTVKILRIGTRIPVVLPNRIDSSLIKIFSKYSGLWIATHFNHPNELTPLSMNACKKFINNGIPVVNQTVLLKNINDNADILEKLFVTLVENNIKPLYLFHIDPVKGNEHFATGIEKGIKLIEQLRNRISSLATPVFAIDLPEGAGKVPLLPNYKTKDGKFIGIDSKIVKY